MSTHEQRTEWHSSMQYAEDGSVQSSWETSRAVCSTCMERNTDDDGPAAVAVDWPCSTVKAREAVALLNSMILSGEDHSDASRAAVRRAMDDTT